MAAIQMPKKTEAEQAARKAALETATVHAIKVPFTTMQRAYDCFDLLQYVAEQGNPNSVSDAGVAALAAEAAVVGAGLNVRINAADVRHRPDVQQMLADAAELVAKAAQRRADILAIVNNIIDK